MKKRVCHSYNDEINSKNINALLNSNFIIENKSARKIRIEQNLFHYKTSLNVLLNLIKSFQNDFFSKQKKNGEIRDIIKMISSLQNNLSLMLTEKQKQFDYLKTKIENNKKKMQDILFIDNQNKKVINKKINDISNAPLMSKKRELDLINFQIRNEIKKTNYLIEQKSQIYFYAKSLPFVLDINREKFCNTNFENLEIISQILNNVKKSVKENFILVVKEKMESELEINTLTLKINSLKENKIKDNLNNNNKYIDTEDIIYEDTKENNKTLLANQSRRNSYLFINKLNMNKRASIYLLKKMRERKLSLDSLFQDNILVNDIQNNISNYLNMNINVNINLNEKSFKNKNSNFSSSEENNKSKEDEKYENEINEKNKI